ncbi:MAG: hypothetical protein ACLFTR_04495 [Candidatus Woesearchaeota archaeon]
MYFRDRGYNRLLVKDPYEDIESLWRRELLEVNDDEQFDRADV